jgi:hypothetical protein
MILLADRLKVAGLEVINPQDFLGLILRFAFNTAIVVVLVRYMYYSVAKRKDYLFTYMMISVVVFLLCYLLESVKLELGFALGLFAVFGIIRYRTDSMPIKEMTYLFVVIGITVINALANKKISVAELMFTNLVILFMVYGYEKIWLLKHESAKLIVYDRIDLIVPEKYLELLADLRQRTGLEQIHRVDVGRIDFVRDVCRLTIYYEDRTDYINLADQADQVVSHGDGNDD